MDRYWSRFASTWDVLLHGSPAVDVFGGIKLAAGGELGMGVGEEEWGSSERDVLEDFARRTDGLVDVMVSRFGEPSSSPALDIPNSDPWIGSGSAVNAADGVVFSGLGALSRTSLCHLSHWVETMYSYGDQAYGVRENPTSDRRKRRRRDVKRPLSPVSETRKITTDARPRLAASNIDSGLPPGIPPPIVKSAESALAKASAAVDQSRKDGNQTSYQEPGTILASLGDTETWMKYMTLGYGTAWGGKKGAEDASSTPSPSPSAEAMRYIDPAPDVDLAAEKMKAQIRQENDGYFLIGLKGDMDDLDHDDNNDEGTWNNRILLRTVHVEVVSGSGLSMSPSVDSDETPAYEKELNFKATTSNRLSRLRPVVYVVSARHPLS